jgi:tetratricopeptide (TPR) repeat protein
MKRTTKRTILFLAGVAAVSGVAIYYMAKSTNQSAPPAAPAVAETVADPVTADAPKSMPLPAVPRASHAEAAVSEQTSGVPSLASVASVAFTSAIDTLVSPQATYAEKQAAWKQLQDSGRLADAAAELAQRMANDPQNALYPAALGQAYLKLCATTTDVRAQAIWAMNADADFETALNLDPSNWDARYTKAVAMSYWPANLNKGDEVIQQFNTLIEQQEQQAPQPQFAQAYEWLGKQYRKAGQPDAAQQVWQRGASLYPDNQSLQSLLTAPAASQP